MHRPFVNLQRQLNEYGLKLYYTKRKKVVYKQKMGWQ